MTRDTRHCNAGPPGWLQRPVPGGRCEPCSPQCAPKVSKISCKNQIEADERRFFWAGELFRGARCTCWVTSAGSLVFPRSHSAPFNFYLQTPGKNILRAFWSFYLLIKM